jgi:hypothetical protein
MAGIGIAAGVQHPQLVLAAKAAVFGAVALTAGELATFAGFLAGAEPPGRVSGTMSLWTPPAW